MALIEIEKGKKQHTIGKEKINKKKGIKKHYRGSKYYPVQKWEKDNLQFVLHIMIIDLEIVLGIRKVPADLLAKQLNEKER